MSSGRPGKRGGGGGGGGKKPGKSRKPKVSKSSVEILEEETKRMEERLAELRTRMTQDRSAHDQQVRTTGYGVRWAAARPSKNYMKEVMEQSHQSAQYFANRPGSRSGRSSSSSSRRSAAHDPTRPQYIAPTNGPSRLHSQLPTNSSSVQDGAPGSLLQGNYNEREASSAFQEARKEWLQNADPSPSNPSSSSSTSSSSAMRAPRARTVNKEIIPSGAQGNLLRGDFDESKSHDAFAAARAEWLASAQGLQQNPKRAVPEENGASLIANAANKTQVVRSSTSSTNMTRTRKGIEIAPNVSNIEIRQGSLLDGAFDERESHKEFEDARRLWLDHSVEHFSHVGNGEDYNTAPTSHWNVGMAQNPDLQAELKKHEVQEKLACYHCYKIFYADKQTKQGNKGFCSKQCLREYGKSQIVVCRSADCNNRFNKSETGRLSGYCDKCTSDQKQASDYAEVARVKARTQQKQQQQHRVAHQSLHAISADKPVSPNKVVPVLPLPAQPYRPDDEPYVQHPLVSARRDPNADTAAPVVEFPDDSD